jgi:hypothetical protein
VLFGNSSADLGTFSGGRFTAGTWLDADKSFGVEAIGFFLGQQSSTRTFAVAGGPLILGVPFFNTATGTEDFSDVADPGETFGRVEISTFLRYWGAEANLLCNLFCNCNLAVDALVGFRNLNLDEGLRISAPTEGIPGDAILFFNGSLFFPPVQTTSTDTFRTHNHFYGGQVGARAWWQGGNVFAALAAKVALGSTHQVVDVSGSSELRAGGTGPILATAPGGLFAQPSNSGRFSHDDFAVVPEVGANIGYQLTGWMRLFVGYRFTYWSSVVRPGDQINRNVNPTQVPTFIEFGTPSPVPPAAPVFRTTDFWAQGLSFGVAFLF